MAVCNCRLGVLSNFDRRQRDLREAKQHTRAMSKVRVAFVGCGGITEKHVEAADASGRVTITALVDPSLEARERISAVIVALGAPAPTQFSSLAEALAADPGKELFSAVDIMVPSFLVNGADLHETVATEALRGGRHVLLEKPVTTTPAAAIRLKKAHLELCGPADCGPCLRSLRCGPCRSSSARCFNADRVHPDAPTQIELILMFQRRSSSY